MVGSLLALDQPIASEDACDALAAAICHATKRSVLKRIEVSR
jgi:Holliday junction resolvasome RuvABC endonuclease subunit